MTKEQEYHIKALQSYNTDALAKIKEVVDENKMLRDQLKQKDELIKELKHGLQELIAKEVEYKECAVAENMNYEYFKGKRDAYEFSVKTIKRILEWHKEPVS